LAPSFGGPLKGGFMKSGSGLAHGLGAKLTPLPNGYHEFKKKKNSDAPSLSEVMVSFHRLWCRTPRRQSQHHPRRLNPTPHRN